jgi:hypothetical protein
MNNHVVSELDRGRYQTSYIQNHASLKPLVKDIVSKHMIIKVAASGLSHRAFFIAFKKGNVNRIKKHTW